MIHVSKRAAAIALVEKQRQAAFHTRDLPAFSEATEKIKEIEETMPDEYTCLHCGEDFPADKAHVEYLIAGLIVFEMAPPTMPNEEFNRLFAAGEFDKLANVPQQVPIPDAAPELTATERYDFGIQGVTNGAPGRRLKICGDCAGQLAIHPRDYISRR